MIADALLKTGLLQVGMFANGTGTKPYRLCLDMLPAYPALCSAVAQRVTEQLPEEPFDRLLAHSECAVLGGLVSARSGISLVYSRGKGEVPVHDLVGAYDVGHPACLLVNYMSVDVEPFMEKAQRVGLEIHTIVEVMHTGYVPAVHQRLISAYRLNEVIRALQHSGNIPDGQAQQILTYIA